jgi:DNA polymerase-3 subunit gamma/tau
MSIDDDALRLLAAHGNGSFRDSISMLDQLTGFQMDTITGTDVARLLGVPDSETLEILLDAMTTSNVEKLFDSMQTLRERGSNPSKVAQTMISLLRTKLTQPKLLLPYNWTVTLMKQLLPLTATSSATFEILEVVFLDAITIQDTVATTQSHTPVAEVSPKTSFSQTSEIMKDEKPEKKQDTDKTTVTKTKTTEDTPLVAKNSSSEDPWDRVLAFMKTNHNTLYGVLRMAEVTDEDDNVTLTFKFEFHKKKLTESRNIKILHDSIAEAYGSTKEITLLVNKATKTKPIATQKAEDAPLANISNIFGGAELLD